MVGSLRGGSRSGPRGRGGCRGSSVSCPRRPEFRPPGFGFQPGLGFHPPGLDFEPSGLGRHSYLACGSRALRSGGPCGPRGSRGGRAGGRSRRLPGLAGFSRGRSRQTSRPAGRDSRRISGRCGPPCGCSRQLTGLAPGFPRGRSRQLSRPAGRDSLRVSGRGGSPGGVARAGAFFLSQRSFRSAAFCCFFASTNFWRGSRCSPPGRQSRPRFS